jgi:integrase/recombinase XerD
MGHVLSLSLSQAIEGFLLDAAARSLSPRTVADYENSFRKLRAFLGDPPIADVTADDVRRFLASLSAVAAAPAGVARRPARAIGKKQKLNIHTGLSALWTWALAGQYVTAHVVRQVQRPKPEKPVIVPFSQEDLRGLLAATGRRSAVYSRPGKRACDHARPQALRDRAILLLLLDTGMRASELCGLKLRDVDAKNRAVTVWGKGSKERRLPLGPRSAAALWKYVADARKEATVNEVVFLAQDGAPMTRNGLLRIIYRLGAAAGVADAHPHRFRHTFAIECLRNGMNERTLQELLGHESLEMLRVYTRIAQTDIVNGHQVASPVENWRL